MAFRVMILGVNGFVGHRLAESILSKTSWEIFGIDRSDTRLEACLRYSRFHFCLGNVDENEDWFTKNLKHADVVVVLMAGKEKAWLTDTFELYSNILDLCAQKQKRIVCPVLPDATEKNDQLSYSQKFERLVVEVAVDPQFSYSLFRPFNWFGPGQDDILNPAIVPTPIVSSILSDIIHDRDISLPSNCDTVQCFTYIDDAITALIEVVENPHNLADRQLFDIANPGNEISIRELANEIKNLAMTYPKFEKQARNVEINIGNHNFLELTKPNIENTQQLLKWQPKTSLNVALKNVLDHYLM